MATQQDAGSSKADAAIAFAESQVGKPYRWGATGPDAYDCSGLILASYKHAGVRLTRTTYTMIHEGVEVKRSELAPGDLIFPNPGHVQLYVGGGKVCEAPQNGVPVRVVPVWGFWRARRVTAPGTGGGTVSAPVASSGASDFAALPGLGDIPGVGALEWITEGHNWLRIAEFIAGVIVLFVALKTLGS